MPYGIKLKVWGAYASFNRPEMKVERVTYDVMTPSAARGILEAIYWKPAFRWVIDAIHVFKPIRRTHVRRNELAGKIPAKSRAGTSQPGRLGVDISHHRQQRAAMVLCNVCYGIEAHVEIIQPDIDPNGKPISSPETKHLESFKRRASNGQFFHQPYLGTREFPAYFELVGQLPATPKEFAGEKVLGLMLHDIDFVEDPKNGSLIESNKGRRLRATPRFFEAVLRDGVLRIPPLDHLGGQI